MSQNNLGSEVRVYTDCLLDRFPIKDKNGVEIKKPKIELFAFKLGFTDGDLTEEQRNTAILFGVEEELAKQRGNLILETPRFPSDFQPINFHFNPKTHNNFHSEDPTANFF